MLGVVPRCRRPPPPRYRLSRYIGENIAHVPYFRVFTGKACRRGNPVTRRGPRAAHVPQGLYLPETHPRGHGPQRRTALGDDHSVSTAQECAAMVRACRLVDDTPHALPRLWELYRIIVTVRQQSANSFLPVNFSLMGLDKT